MRRFTSILFLFLACTLLMAHSMLPHHHHSEVPCFAQEHCKHEDSNTSPQKHDSPADKHEHEDSFCCVLKQDIASSDARKTVTSNPEITKKVVQKLALFSCAAIQRFDFSNLHTSNLYRYKPDECLYRFLCVNSSCGLRAPPFSLV